MIIVSDIPKLNSRDNFGLSETLFSAIVFHMDNKELRSRFGLTGRALAKLTGVGETTMSEKLSSRFPRSRLGRCEATILGCKSVMTDEQWGEAVAESDRLMNQFSEDD